MLAEGEANPERVQLQDQVQQEELVKACRGSGPAPTLNRTLGHPGPPRPRAELRWVRGGLQEPRLGFDALTLEGLPLPLADSRRV